MDARAPKPKDEEEPKTKMQTIKPIGRVESCFRECRGTPRQGFAPATRGRLVFQRNVPPVAFAGLGEYDYVWVVFLFHYNTNNNRVERAHRDMSHSFPGKVKPPKLKGAARGIFATRTPHRPNPIGITLVKWSACVTSERLM